MSIYNIFPKELWISIILELPCKYINNFSNINNTNKDLIDQENLIHRMKISGYPRTSGQCKVFDVTYYGIGVCLNVILDRLYDDDVDLVRGDLINFKTDEKHIFLFDGEKLVDTYQGKFSIFPNDFDNINDNIPFGYWYQKIPLSDNNLYIDSKFRFDNNLVREQTIKNCQYTNIGLSCTWFVLNNKYYIIDYYGFIRFKKILKNDELFLEVNSSAGYKNKMALKDGKIFSNIGSDTKFSDEYQIINNVYVCNQY